MLDNSNVSTRIPAQDLDRARTFYRDRLGLTPLEERPGGILSFAIIKSVCKRLTWSGMATNNRDPCQSSFCPSFDSFDSC
jgi:hypothetical protein